MRYLHLEWIGIPNGILITRSGAWWVIIKLLQPCFHVAVSQATDIENKPLRCSKKSWVLTENIICYQYPSILLLRFNKLLYNKYGSLLIWSKYWQYYWLSKDYFKLFYFYEKVNIINDLVNSVCKVGIKLSIGTYIWISTERKVKSRALYNSERMMRMTLI